VDGIEQQKGYGLGKLIMSVLLTDAKLKGVDNIQLSVDNDNIRAVQIYQKLGFEIIEKKATFSFLKYTL
jgi:ribosomal protein S18 acetylase RimI-like enzyme